MQGVYFRLSARVPWVLVRLTRSVADAEGVARRVAKDKCKGKLLYVEAPSLPDTVWDLRSLVHRRLGGWLCKALLPGFRKVKQSGRAVWQKHPVGQLSLFG